MFVKNTDNEYTSSIDPKKLGPVSAEDVRELINNTTEKIINRLERVGDLNPSDIIDQEINFGMDLATALKKKSIGNSVGAANTPSGGIGNIMNNDNDDIFTPIENERSY